MTALSEAFAPSKTTVATIGATHTWSANVDSFDTNASGQVILDNSAIRVAIPNAALASPDHYSEVVVHGYNGGVAVRVTGGGNFDCYYIRADQGSGVLQVYRWFSTFVGQLNAPGGMSFPAVLRAKASTVGSDAVIEVFWNGVSAGTVTQVGGKLDGNYAGIHAKGIPATMDDWAAADSVSTPNTPPTITTNEIHGSGSCESVYSNGTYDNVANEFTFSGTSSDSDGTVTLVQTRVDGGAWQAATGTANWTQVVALSSLALSLSGEHTIEARAQDDDGDYSAIASRTFYYSPTGMWRYGTPHLRPINSVVVF